MIPEKSRQERIDAIFEQELHAKPRDENFKPKLANGGYFRTDQGAVVRISGGEIIWATSDQFDKLSISISYTSEQLKLMSAQFDKLGGWMDDGA